MHDTDLSNILFLADRRLRKAIFDDMCIQSAIACASKEDGNWQHGGPDRVHVVPPYEGEHEELGKFRHGEGPRPPLSLGSVAEKAIVDRSFRNTPAAGEGTKTFITNVYPQLSRLSGAMERWVLPPNNVRNSFTLSRSEIVGGGHAHSVLGVVVAGNW